MSKDKKIICPLCGAPMEHNMSKTLLHFQRYLNTIGVYDCTKCDCTRTITTDDSDDEY